MVARGRGRREWGMSANGCGFVFGVMKILTMVMAARMCDHIKNH